MSEAPIDVRYDGGHFDKDEQGWVEDWTRVVQVGPLLRVERAGTSALFRLGRRWPHAGFVELQALNDRHPWWLAFDLVAQRLVGGRLPTSVSRAWSGSPRPLAEPRAALGALLAACVAGTRELYPASSAATPAPEALAAVLAGPEADLRLDAPAAPGPGVYRLAWRREGPGIASASTRTASAVGEPFVAISQDAAGRVDLLVDGPGLEALDAAFAAIDRALRADRA